MQEKLSNHKLKILLWLCLMFLMACLEPIPEDSYDEWPATMQAAFDFGTALLAHDESVYELGTEAVHDEIDTWFESIVKIECRYPGPLAGGRGSSKATTSISAFMVQCHSSQPTCPNITFHDLVLTRVEGVDGNDEKYLIDSWSHIELCDVSSQFEQVVLTPMPNLSPQTITNEQN